VQHLQLLQWLQQSIAILPDICLDCPYQNNKQSRVSFGWSIGVALPKSWYIPVSGAGRHQAGWRRVAASCTDAQHLAKRQGETLDLHPDY
jgi:hypothetical protein